MVNGDVVGVEQKSTTWWRGFHGLHRLGCLGRGRGCVSISHLSPSISSFHCKERKKKKKSGVLLVCDFLAPGLRVNYSLVGKQSLLSTTAELKLFSNYITFDKY
jgi:hypothetical protein